MTAIPTHAVDVFLDAVRLVQAVLDGDGDAYNSVVRTTEATPTEIVFALTTILAAAAAEQADPDQAIRDLRNAFVNVSTS